MPETIVVDRLGALARITLDRPEALNALDPLMLEELVAALADTASDPDVTAVVLTGRGRLFSAGVDLDTPFFMEHVDDPSIFSGKRLLDSQHRVIRAIHELPVPTFAALNGPAVGGGGFGLAMACDIRISVRAAYFWMVPGALDVVQDFGLSWMLQRVIGPSRTLHMAMTGYRLTAEEGQEWGLVNELVDDQAALDARIEELSASVTAMGGDAVRMLKTIVRTGASSTLQQQLELEAIANGLTFQSDEFQRKKAAYLAAKTAKSGKGKTA